MHVFQNKYLTAVAEYADMFSECIIYDSVNFHLGMCINQQAEAVMDCARNAGRFL